MKKLALLAILLFSQSSLSFDFSGFDFSGQEKISNNNVTSENFYDLAASYQFTLTYAHSGKAPDYLPSSELFDIAHKTGLFAGYVTAYITMLSENGHNDCISKFTEDEILSKLSKNIVLTDKSNVVSMKPNKLIIYSLFEICG